MAAQDVQTLLRFLSQEAKVPMATAIAKAKALHGKSLMGADTIAKASLKDIEAILNDAKLAKQVHNAAKRVSKKRPAPDGNVEASPSKRGKQSSAGRGASQQTPAQLEESLVLPYSEASEGELAEVAVFTNRAPLVLAFAVTLLKYTMPEQPLSSRLSLAHAYVSVSSRGRAVDLGIASGASAGEEGWGQGQPVVRIMDKDIHVARRPGYDPNEGASRDQAVKHEGRDSKVDNDQKDEQHREDALWGLDLEKLKSNKSAAVNFGGGTDTMPIFTPQSARTYLLKAAGSDPGEEDEVVIKEEGSDESKPVKKKKKSAVERREENERNLGKLLKAIDMLYRSWASELGPDQLDKRTWGWYADVRPEIAHGREGWGAKNTVKLSHILALQKKAK